MCILMPDYIWMATGYKTGLNEKVLQPLKGHNVILFPDKTEYGAWADKTAMLAAKSFKISCSCLLESYDLDEGPTWWTCFLNMREAPTVLTNP
ncbi:hypothetical protein H4O18_17720 [Arenibacter sp. BSSL-BM3]|uniref:DUF6371 domain-containing protein n=2 Tax=Arenibacter arenosicollis TaxID=2762274 RepID=A0ABR7QRL0_9FLAO|nr:hypothetical protein [Arenibacter arenosicollis]